MGWSGRPGVGLRISRFCVGSLGLDAESAGRGGASGPGVVEDPERMLSTRAIPGAPGRATGVTASGVFSLDSAIGAANGRAGVGPASGTLIGAVVPGEFGRAVAATESGALSLDSAIGAASGRAGPVPRSTFVVATDAVV